MDLEFAVTPPGLLAIMTQLYHSKAEVAEGHPLQTRKQSSITAATHYGGGGSHLEHATVGTVAPADVERERKGMKARLLGLGSGATPRRKVCSAPFPRILLALVAGEP